MRKLLWLLLLLLLLFHYFALLLLSFAGCLLHERCIFFSSNFFQLCFFISILTFFNALFRLQPYNGGFITSCWTHCESIQSPFNQFVINGKTHTDMSFFSLLHAWMLFYVFVFLLLFSLLLLFSFFFTCFNSVVLLQCVLACVHVSDTFHSFPSSFFVFVFFNVYSKHMSGVSMQQAITNWWSSIGSSHVAPNANWYV